MVVSLRRLGAFTVGVVGLGVDLPGSEVGVTEEVGDEHRVGSSAQLPKHRALNAPQ
jgi:hypothetical protein